MYNDCYSLCFHSHKRSRKSVGHGPGIGFGLNRMPVSRFSAAALTGKNEGLGTTSLVYAPCQRDRESKVPEFRPETSEQNTTRGHLFDSCFRKTTGRASFQ